MIKQNKYMRFMASLAETNLISKVAVSSFVFASCGQGLTDEQKATLDSLEGKATFTAEEKKEYDDLKKKKDQFATIQNLSTEMVNYFKTGEAGDAALKTIVSTALGGSIDGGSIADNTLVAAKIQNNAVITDKIANSAVTDAKIGANAVTEAKIQNSAVTTDKIADLNVTRAKIQDDAVTEAKIQNNAVTTDKIANGAVTIVKINNTELEDLIANMIIKSTKPIHGLRSKFENADNNDGTKKLYELLYPIVAMHPGSDAEAITFDNIANVANNDTLTSINAAIRGDNKQNGQVFIIGDGIFKLHTVADGGHKAVASGDTYVKLNNDGKWDANPTAIK